MRAAVPPLRKSKHGNAAEARVDTFTFSYSLREIRKLIENDHSPQPMGVHFITPSTASNDNRITFCHQSAKAQLAGILIMVAQRNYMGDNYANSFLINLSDIADYVGLTNDEICDELETLDREGTISIGKSNQVELVDLEALQLSAAKRAMWWFGAEHARK